MQSTKKKICPFFLKGYCRKGNSCSYSHENSDSQGLISCKLFIEGHCKYGAKCRFNHDKIEKAAFQKTFQNRLQQQQQPQYQEIKSTQNTTKTPLKQFIIISKSQEGQALLAKNQSLYGEEFQNDFIECLQKNSHSVRLNDLIRFFRRFQSSFQFESQNEQSLLIELLTGPAQFKIKYTPTVVRNDLNIQYDIVEGFFIFQINVPQEYPNVKATIINMNESLPEIYRNAMNYLIQRIQLNLGTPYSLMKTFQYMDNRFELFCNEVKKIVESPPTPPNTPEIVKAEGSNEKPWTQSEQSLLENAIIQSKKITDKDQKWECISVLVRTKSTIECQQRFQYCKEVAMKKQQQQLQSESEEDDEEEDEQEDSNEDNSQSDESSSDEDDTAIIPQKIYKDETYKQVFYNQVVMVEEYHQENISLLQFKDISVSVECKKCHAQSQITLSQSNGDYPEGYLVNDIPCVICNVSTKTFFKSHIVHENNPVVGQFGSYTWILVELLKFTIEITCEGCDQKVQTGAYSLGVKQNTQCRKCFKQGYFYYQSLIMENNVVENQAQQIVKKQPTDLTEQEAYSTKTKRIGVFKPGVPLPLDGTCKHYKNSYRWFRFSCCGKAYPCDVCHESQESHMSEPCKNMICGWCSQEQSCKAECQRCSKMTIHVLSGHGFWEGGKGVRNRTLMSKNDSSKYKGLHKTISKRKKRE